MRTIIVSLLCFGIFVTVSAQTEPSVTGPKGMTFVPQGSFQMKTGSEAKMRYITVDAFWMSNEITNSEFREFISWLKENTGEKLYQSRYLTKIVSDKKRGVTKDTVVMDIIPVEVPAILELFDPSCLENSNPRYKGYFSEKKYDDYPVVRVTYNLAEYYCLWKTKMENDQGSNSGSSPVHTFRLPLEEEWEYAAQEAVKKKEISSQGIHRVNKNEEEPGLLHFSDNVSEWVRSASEQNQGVVRGGSWKTENTIFLRGVKVVFPDIFGPVRKHKLDPVVNSKLFFTGFSRNG